VTFFLRHLLRETTDAHQALEAVKVASPVMGVGASGLECESGAEKRANQSGWGLVGGPQVDKLSWAGSIIGVLFQSKGTLRLFEMSTRG